MAGRTSNLHPERVVNHVYFTTSMDTAVWGAELAAALGGADARGHVYQVQPTGAFEDDPNVSDKKFPGNPTRSYRSRHPLRITGQLHHWRGHDRETLQAMLDGLRLLARAGAASSKTDSGPPSRRRTRTTAGTSTTAGRTARPSSRPPAGTPGGRRGGRRPRWRAVPLGSPFDRDGRACWWVGSGSGPVGCAALAAAGGNWCVGVSGPLGPRRPNLVGPASRPSSPPRPLPSWPRPTRSSTVRGRWSRRGAGSRWRRRP